MKRIPFFILFSFFAFPVLCQTIYDSRNGSTFPTQGEIRILNIFINIIYDQTPERDPYINMETPVWEAGDPDLINSGQPVYLKQFMDPDLGSGQPKGLMTRLFYEASLGKLILLGDFVVVNVLQSEVTAKNSGANFTSQQLIASAIAKINKSGGLQTVYGHDSIGDYDKLAVGSLGLPKTIKPNGKFDYVQVLLRNTTNGSDAKGRFDYGHLKPGQGMTYAGKLCSPGTIKVGNAGYVNELSSIQCVGDKNLAADAKSIIFHEFAHNLFGGNDFHATGGNHYSTFSPNVFMGFEGGHGLMGGYNSGLVCVNAYERWRLGWISEKDNPKDFPIACNGKASDISVEDGVVEFIARDFITSGDAIRIKLPYVDDPASAQYLWIENHQVGYNGKIDYLQYSNSFPCRHPGTNGLYMYIQVGRDSLTSTRRMVVFPSNQTDNLRMLSAEGNWDMELVSKEDSIDCIVTSGNMRSIRYVKPNAFCGYNDQQTHFLDIPANENKIRNAKQADYSWIKYKGNRRFANLPSLGDQFDAFTGDIHLTMASNPATTPIITHYVKQGPTYLNPIRANKDNKNVWISGLGIKAKELEDGSYKISIRWDDYAVENKCRWTGSIMQKETVLIEKGGEISLEQGMTPTQHIRDTISGYFTPQSSWTLLPGSLLHIKKGGKLVIKEGSNLIVSNGAHLIVDEGGLLFVRKDGNIKIEDQASLEISGKVKVKSGANIECGDGNE